MERFVDIVGRKTWTRVIGQGPAIVLCSGAGAARVGNWPDVEEQAVRFATVVTYDRAGTGRSDAPQRRPTAADMAEELTAVLDALAIARPVVLVGPNPKPQTPNPKPQTPNPGHTLVSNETRSNVLVILPREFIVLKLAV